MSLFPASVAPGATRVIRYYGSYELTNDSYQADAALAAKTEWYPISQQYTPGTWSMSQWVLAFLLLVLLIGIIVLAYMVVARPDGVLVVTYEHRPARAAASRDQVVAVTPPVADDAMACPRCAEVIKRAAKMCRFCQLDLTQP